MNRLLRGLPKQAQFGLILMLVVVLTQLLGQAGTTLLDLAWKKGARVSVVDGAVELLVAAAFVAGVFWIGHAWPRPSRSIAWMRAFLAAAAVVSSNTFLNTVGTIVGGVVGESSVGWLLLLTLVVGIWGWAALVCLPRVQKWFAAQVDRFPEEKVKHGPGHVVLVMLVSQIDDDSLDVAGGTVCRRRLTFDSLTSDIEALHGTSWRWQQLMRAIEPAVKRTAAGDRTTIVLVGSAGHKGSFRQLGACAAFLRRYPEVQDERRVTVCSSSEYLRATAPRAGMRLTPVDTAEGGIEFEDFNAVRQHILLVAHVAACQVGGDRVFVDVTGGQKTTSIAAAVATTGETGFCQYVQTNSPYDVVCYDLHPPELPAI